MDKNEELQKWLNDDRYVRRCELDSMFGLSDSGSRTFLTKHKISPCKVFAVKGVEIRFYDKNQCIEIRQKQQRGQDDVEEYANNKLYIRPYQLGKAWGLCRVSVSTFLISKKIKPVKRFHLASFYDRAECERARPFINQPEQKEVEKVENIEELATATKRQILNETGADNFVWDKVTMKNKIMPVKNYCDERGNFVSLFKKDETVSAILAYKNEQKQLLEKCLADKNLVTTTQLAKLWNLDKSAVYNKIYRLKIKPFAKIKLENGSMWHFYKKSDCIESQEVEKVEEKQMELPEPKEQTPDIIPADTIDLFTMSELESELKKRGVELTANVRTKINASDMPEMKHIATMLRGNAKSIAIRLSVLNEIAGQLREVESKKESVDNVAICNKGDTIFLYKQDARVFKIIKKLCVSAEYTTTSASISRVLRNDYGFSENHSRTSTHKATNRLFESGYIDKNEKNVIKIYPKYFESNIALKKSNRVTKQQALEKRNILNDKLDLILSKLDCISELQREIADLKKQLAAR